MRITASLRAALYARAATSAQGHDGGSAAQVTALRRRSAAAGCAIAEELCFVADGWGGATLWRPALQRLRDQVGGGGRDRLYVYSPDRLCRDFADQRDLVDQPRRCGVEVVFLKR